MKTFLVFCLVLAFTCVQSAFTPQWTSCEKPAFGWVTNNVTLDAAPIAGQNSTFTFCGTNSVWYTVHFTEVRVSSQTGLDLVIPLENIYIPFEATGCYDVNFQIPEGNKDLSINFSSIFLLAEFGCVNVTLSLENNNKFLAF